MRRLLLSLGCAAFANCLPAQAGDAKDAPGVQQAPPSGYPIPEAPALSPSEALAQFVVAPGLRVELVAAEPQVVAPVCITTDGHGRLWVVEMRSYMPDVDGRGETKPDGAIAVLQDRDGDGRFETRTTFLDGLVLPRAVCVLGDRVLVIEPPRLWLCTDRDGDLRADTKVEVDTGFGGIDSPEHAANGLLCALDNRIYLSGHRACYRLVGDQLLREASLALGQWGITQDDLGRLYYNDNSTHLRTDSIGRQLAIANPRHGRARGLDVVPCRDQSVWPVRVTPGVNRGYQPGVLAAGKLTKFTAACSPLVYRGDLLAAHRGDLFVCEPAANLVRCDRLAEADGEVVAAPRWRDREVLASHDERFRPVALAEGLDGALYVADLARGVIQHRLFVTTFLRKQIEARSLAAPLDRGRIWRLVPDGAARRVVAPLPPRSPAELVAALGDPAGAVRDLAQQELVRRADARAIAPLRATLRGAEAACARRHALWTLAGLAAVEPADLAVAARDADASVRAGAYELIDAALRTQPSTILAAVLLGAAAQETERRALRTLAAVLGRVPHADAPTALAQLIARSPGDETLASLALAGLAERELEFARALLGVTTLPPTVAVRTALASAAAAVVRGKRGEQLTALLALLAVPTPPAVAAELLKGIETAAPRGNAKQLRAGSLGADPAVRAAAAALAVPEPLRARWAALAPAFTAPVAPPPARELSAAEQVAFARGREVFAICAGCHGAAGEGTGEAPPLAGSEFVAGRVDRLARIAMHGLEGPIEVDGQRWDKAMPKVALDDRDLAAVLTYVRITFAAGAPVELEFVRALRDATAGRDKPYTAAELGK